MGPPIARTAGRTVIEDRPMLAEAAVPWKGHATCPTSRP